MNVSRREFLQASLGGLGVVVVCACGGIGVAAWLLAKRTPPPTEYNAALATSAANRQPFLKSIERPPIIARAEWGALEPNHEAENEQGFYTAESPEGWRIYEADLRDTYTTLVVHHSVIDEGDDLTSLLEIQRLHRQDRQWADVAYHYFIGSEGAVYEGRNLAVRGTHVAGYNTGSLGVCLIGNFMENSPTEAQLTALTGLGRWLAVRLQLTHLAGHRDFNTDTLCPGDNMAIYLTDLAASLGLAFGTEGYQSPTS